MNKGLLQQYYNVWCYMGCVHCILIVIALGHVYECVLKFYLQFENMIDNSVPDIENKKI